jgi:hypothetical protein
MAVNPKQCLSLLIILQSLTRPDYESFFEWQKHGQRLLLPEAAMHSLAVLPGALQQQHVTFTSPSITLCTSVQNSFTFRYVGISRSAILNSLEPGIPFAASI